MCEANIVLLPGWATSHVRDRVHRQGNEPKRLHDLHRIWQEVLAEFVTSAPELMVKRLRDRMVMVPV